MSLIQSARRFLGEFAQSQTNPLLATTLRSIKRNLSRKASLLEGYNTGTAVRYDADKEAIFVERLNRAGYDSVHVMVTIDTEDPRRLSMRISKDRFALRKDSPAISLDSPAAAINRLKGLLKTPRTEFAEAPSIYPDFSDIDNDISA